jgi:hypothetical protein
MFTKTLRTGPWLRITIALVSAAACAAEAAVIESYESRYGILTNEIDPGGVGNTWAMKGIDGVPPLTRGVAFRDGKFLRQGPLDFFNSDSVRGYWFSTSPPLNRSDGLGLWTQGSTLVQCCGLWGGGTGAYENASGRGVNAGFATQQSPTSFKYSLSEFGYLEAPNIPTPGFVSGDVSDPNGNPRDTSIMNAPALGFYDVSSDQQNQVSRNGASSGALSIVAPFALDHFETAPDGTFLWTGPGGNFVSGTWNVSCPSFLNGDCTVYDVPIPGPDPEQHVIFAGYQMITGGGGDGYVVTGGALVFTGMNTFASRSTFDGSQRLLSYGWLEAQPVPEPKTWALFVSGLALLVLALRRSR